MECQHCNHGAQMCPQCGGNGTTDPPGGWTSSLCRRCRGKGEIACDVCEGTGEVDPPLVQTGQSSYKKEYRP